MTGPRAELWFRLYDGRGQPKAPDLSRPWSVLLYVQAEPFRWDLEEIMAATPNELAALLDERGLVVPRLDLLQLWCEKWYGPAPGRWQEAAHARQ